ncbi:unnamed protein product [Mytilus edulis]|uniref:C2H2-type domain-containing protein n=1 Tax=Mytilus edulis TaxID=6550 RepID=A0A8S3SEV2_MYTED|nr:unnamed protein product [Mytilus edulis]
MITNTAVREDLQHYTEKIQSEQTLNRDLSKMNSCDDCGVLFETIHDLQRHIKTWCPENKESKRKLPEDIEENSSAKKARLDNQSDNEYVLNDTKQENKAYLKIGKISRDYNEEAREVKIKKYLKRGLSKTEAKQRANDKLKNEDWIIFMNRYLQVIEYIMRLKYEKMHVHVMNKVEAYLRDGFDENRAIQMAIKKYRHQLENFIEDSQSSGKDDDTESKDNESDHGNDSHSGSEDENTTDEETDNESEASE